MGRTGESHLTALIAYVAEASRYPTHRRDGRAMIPSDIPLSGPWSREDVDDYLEHTAIPVRFAVTSPSDRPTVVSLWFLVEDGNFLCATQKTASVVRAVEQNPRCAFEVAGDRPPYRGVRGRGIAELDSQSGARVLEQLIGRYLGSTESELARWLLGRADGEVCIRIRPTRLMSWDFTERMADSILD